MNIISGWQQTNFQMEVDRLKGANVAFLSVMSNAFVVLSKFVVGLLTGSVAIISEAIHSALDLAASLIAFFSIRISGRTADQQHPYGHGKVENVSGTIETILIFVAGIWIIYECVHKIIHPSPVELPYLGIIVMLIGAGINYWVSRKLKKTAAEMNSVAMKSNALHLLTDVFTSLGVAFSLLLVTITGWNILDPVIGIILAFYIMREAYKLMKESFPPLIDARLSEEEEENILRIIHSFEERYIEVHNFRTRRSGPEENIDFHLIVPSNMSVITSHQLSDEMEQAIKQVFHRAQVLIHIEPEHERINQ